MMLLKHISFDNCLKFSSAVLESMVNTLYLTYVPSTHMHSLMRERNRKVLGVCNLFFNLHSS